MDLGSLAFRTFAQATEDEQKVKGALQFACGCDEITKEGTTGFHGNPIIIMEAKISSAKAINDFFGRLQAEEIEHLRETIEKRIDEDSFFFMRLDKQLAHRGELKLSNADDVIAVRCKVKSYPKKRGNAVKVMTQYLNDLVQRKKNPREIAKD